MSLRVGCECGARLKVREQYAGQTIQCLACGRPIPIPELAVLLAQASGVLEGGEPSDSAEAPAGPEEFSGTPSDPAPATPTAAPASTESPAADLPAAGESPAASPTEAARRSVSLLVSCACGARLKLRESYAGQTIQCIACNQPIEVPPLEEFLASAARARPKSESAPPPEPTADSAPAAAEEARLDEPAGAATAGDAAPPEAGKDEGAGPPAGAEVGETSSPAAETDEDGADEEVEDEPAAGSEDEEWRQYFDVPAEKPARKKKKGRARPVDPEAAAPQEGPAPEPESVASAEVPEAPAEEGAPVVPVEVAAAFESVAGGVTGPEAAIEEAASERPTDDSAGPADAASAEDEEGDEFEDEEDAVAEDEEWRQYFDVEGGAAPPERRTRRKRRAAQDSAGASAVPESPAAVDGEPAPAVAGAPVDAAPAAPHAPLRRRRRPINLAPPTWVFVVIALLGGSAVVVGAARYLWRLAPGRAPYTVQVAEQPADWSAAPKQLTELSAPVALNGYTLQAPPWMSLMESTSNSKTARTWIASVGGRRNMLSFFVSTPPPELKSKYEAGGLKFALDHNVDFPKLQDVKWGAEPVLQYESGTVGELLCMRCQYAMVKRPEVRMITCCAYDWPRMITITVRTTHAPGSVQYEQLLSSLGSLRKQ